MKTKLTGDDTHPIAINLGGIWHHVTIDEAIAIADDIQKSIIEIGNEELAKLIDEAESA